MSTTRHTWSDVEVLLRGEQGKAADWTLAMTPGRMTGFLVTAVVGSALFGAAMGWWRAPEQAIYTAVKFPAVVLLTMVGNAMLNAMLAPLLGVNIRGRQTFMAVMMSFVMAAVILGALSPVLAFLIWNTPPLEMADQAGSSHAFILLSIVAMVAFAGVAANLRLYQLLVALSGSALAARKVLFAWLAGNLFLGSQISWILRPFIGTPGLPVQFLRDDPMHGSFFEAVVFSLKQLFTQ